MVKYWDIEVTGKNTEGTEEDEHFLTPYSRTEGSTCPLWFYSSFICAEVTPRMVHSGALCGGSEEFVLNFYENFGTRHVGESDLTVLHIHKISPFKGTALVKSAFDPRRQGYTGINVELDG